MRKLLFLIFFITRWLGYDAYSQITINPIIFSSNDYDMVHDVCQDTQGNVYVLASSWTQNQGSISKPGKEIGSFGYGPFVMVYNAAGALVKTMNVGFVGNYLKSIAVDKTGNIYLTGSQQQYILVVAKLDHNFKQLWSLTEGTSAGIVGNKVLVDETGNVYVGGQVDSWSVFGLRLRERACCSGNDFLIKVNEAGKLQWIKAGLGENIDASAASIAMDKTGNIILVGRTNGAGTYGSTLVSSGLLVVKYAPNGNTIWAKNYGFTQDNFRNMVGYAIAQDVTVDELNNIYVAGSMGGKPKFGDHNLTIPSDIRDAMLFKLLPDGQVDWVKAGGYPTRANEFSTISYKDNQVHVAGYSDYLGFLAKSTIVAARYDTKGRQLWKMNLDEKMYGQATKILALLGKTSLLYGQFWNNLIVGPNTIPTVGREDAFQIQLLDASRNHTSCTLQGTLYQDRDSNCQAGESETRLSGIVVQALPGPYYGITDSLGNYAIATDTGTYTVQALLPQLSGRMINQVCTSPGAAAIRVSAPGSIASNVDFGFTITDRPYLEVNIASDRRRRCFRNTTTVSYANIGFAASAQTKVYVQLPPHLEFIKATLPFTKDSKGNYVFDVGVLKPNQRGTITIIDSVSCANPNIRGLTACTKAWITPVNTYPAPSNWNKAELAVMGKTVENNQVRFVIRNTGTGNMTDSLYFRIYQDEDLTLNSKYKLASQDSLVLRFTPVGRAVRVEVDQPEGHPLKATAGTNIEIPAANKFGIPSLLMMAYPPDDTEPEFTEDCLPIIDSFDPNDKQVIPVGLTAENYTSTHAPLRYTIRFQNTGTDVAYRVVVVDTLSTDLDLSTFQVEAVSHGYQLAVLGKVKPVLTFTFDHIMLPDSSHDQAGSNGLIQFSIKPKANLPVKTKIENFADIFFDYNEAVRTNTTTSRIFDMPRTLNADKQLSVQQVIISPSIKGFSPVQSRAGSLVTLTGLDFEPKVTDNTVTFNGVAATVLNATPSTLTVLVPGQAFTGKIKVVTPNGATQSHEDFIIFQPPMLTAVSPAEAIPGTVITLTGNYFSPDAKLDTVTINGLPAKVVEASESRLLVAVPNGATTGKISIRTLGGQAESEQPFIVWYPPVISDFNPGKAKAGITVMLNGHHFAENAARNMVQFGNTPAEVLEASATRLLVKVPPGTPSGKIKLQTPCGQTTTATGFTFIPAPEIASFTPAQGNAGTTVTISGFNFQADGQADTVYFNDKPAKVLKATETSMVVLAPKGVSSGPISVTGAGGKAVTSDFKVLDLEPQDAIAVYPNPTKAEITINWVKANFTIESIRIFNAIGKLVMRKDLLPMPTDELQLTLSPFAPGIYTIRIQTSAGLVVKRVMVF
jgi:uncharacterized repeat protein (TIGR01451 family)